MRAINEEGIIIPNLEIAADTNKLYDLLISAEYDSRPFDKTRQNITPATLVYQGIRYVLHKTDMGGAIVELHPTYLETPGPQKNIQMPLTPQLLVANQPVSVVRIPEDQDTYPIIGTSTLGENSLRLFSIVTLL